MKTLPLPRPVDRRGPYKVPAGYGVLAPARVLQVGQGIDPHTLQASDWPELQDRISAVSMVASVLSVATYIKVHQPGLPRCLVTVRTVHLAALRPGDALCLRGWTSFHGEVAVWPLEKTGPCALMAPPPLNPATSRSTHDTPTH